VQVEGQVRPNVVALPANLFLGVVHAGDKGAEEIGNSWGPPLPYQVDYRRQGHRSRFPNRPPDSNSVHVVPVTFIAGSENRQGREDDPH